MSYNYNYGRPWQIGEIFDISLVSFDRHNVGFSHCLANHKASLTVPIDQLHEQQLLVWLAEQFRKATWEPVSKVRILWKPVFFRRLQNSQINCLQILSNPKPQYHHSQLQNEIISVNFYPNLSKQSARYCNRILMRHKKIEILCPWVTLLVSLVSHFGNLFWACALDVKAAKVFSPAESWVVKSIPSTPAVSKAKTVRTRGRFFGRFFFPFFHFIAIEDVNLIISSHWFAETVVSYLQLPRHWWYHEKIKIKFLQLVILDFFRSPSSLKLE